MKSTARWGPFFHEISIETVFDPYYSQTGDFETNKRCLTLYGTVASAPPNRGRIDESFDWNACETKIDLERFLVNTEEFIRASWPSLTAALILETRLSFNPFELPKTEEEYIDILLNYSSDSSDPKPEREQLVKTLDKYKTDFQTNGPVSSIRKFFSSTSSIISNENVYLYNCLSYIGIKFRQNEIELNTLISPLANSTSLFNINIVSLQNFTRKLEAKCLISKLEPDIKHLADLFGLLLQSDVYVDFHFRPFIQLLQTGLRSEDFESSFITHIRGYAKYHEICDGICKFIEKPDITKNLLPLMNKKFNEIFNGIQMNKTAVFVNYILENMQKNSYCGTVKAFFNEMSIVKNRNILNENSIINLLFNSCKDNEDLKNFFTMVIATNNNSNQNSFNYIAEFIRRIVPDRIRHKFDTLIKCLIDLKNYSIISFDDVSKKIFGIVNHAKFTEAISILYYNQHRPMDILKSVKFILNTICDANSSEMRRFNELIDNLVQFFQSKSSSSKSDMVLCLIDFVYKFTNDTQWFDLHDAFNDFVNDENILTSLKLICIHMDKNLKDDKAPDKNELLCVFENLYHNAKSIFAKTNDDEVIIEFMLTSILGPKIAAETIKCFSGYKNNKKGVCIETILELSNELNKLSPIFKSAFDSESIKLIKDLNEMAANLKNSNSNLQTNFSTVFNFISSMEALFIHDDSNSSKIYKLASLCLKALAMLLHNSNNAINKTSSLVTLYLYLFSLFSYFQDTLREIQKNENIEKTEIVSNVVFSVLFNKRNPIKKRSISPSPSEISLVRSASNVSIRSLTASSSSGVSYVERLDLQTDIEKLLKTLSNDLSSIQKMIEFKDESTLEDLSIEKTNMMIRAIPKLRSCVTEWNNLFSYLSKFTQKNNNNRIFDKLCRESFTISINLLRYMLCVYYSLQQISDNKPLKEFNDDIEHVKKHLLHLEIDENVVELFKELGIHIGILEKNKIKEKPNLKIDLTFLFTMENLPELTVDNNKPNKGSEILEKEEAKIVQDNNENENWFEDLSKISNATAVNESSRAVKNMPSNTDAQNKSAKLKENQQNVKNINLDNLAAETNKKLNKTFEISKGLPPPNQQGVRTKEIQVDLKLSKDLIKGQLKNQNLSEIYKNAKTTKSQPNTIQIADPTAFEIEKIEKWTYQKLVESDSLKKFVSSIVKQLKEKIELDFRDSDKYEFEWCIMVDNSGSMSPKENFVAETLVVIIEVLRRLEHKFAIARFGNVNDTNALLKSYEQPMSFSLGQQILESFTYDQGTYPEDALQNITAKIWPEAKQANKQRIILMITDGLTTQTDDKSWIAIKTQKSFKLGIVVIKDQIQDYLPETFLKEVTEKTSRGNCYRILSPNLSDKLAFEFLYVMIDIFSVVINEINSRTAASLTATTTAANENNSNIMRLIEIPKLNDTEEDKVFFEHVKNLTDNIADMNYEKAKQSGHCNPDLMFKVNGNNDIFKDVRLFSADDLTTTTIDLTGKIIELENYYNNSFTSDFAKKRLDELEKKWNEIENKVAKQIADYTDVMQSTVFTCNKYTRKKASSKGANLYLPGLVKAVISDFNYKKIFSNKSAGGKRIYSIVLAIDASYSMNGHMGQCAIDTLLTFIFSLQKLGIESFSILVFGKGVKIIKLENQAFDIRVFYTLLDNLRFENNNATNDAIAVETAISILSASNTGIKKIFVFTDGFTSYKTKLLKALKKADSLNIDTIGVSVGFEKPFIQNCYKMYINVALPFAFHQALQALYENSDEGIGIKDVDIFSEVMIKDLNSLLEQFKNENVFGKLMSNLKSEREAVLVNGGASDNKFPIDICFCLDATGSMQPWLPEAKAQIKFIVKNLKDEIKKKHSTLEILFNVGILAFRDYSDGENQFQDFYFRSLKTDEDNAAFEKYLDSIIAFGGDDIAEDVLGALNRAITKPEWTQGWKSKVKFMILITDSSAHGKEFSNGPAITDNYSNGSKDGLKAENIMKSLYEKKIEFIMASVLNETAKMAEIFQTHYNDNKEKKKMMNVSLISESAISVYGVRKHYIFLLDKSGSMSGTPWLDLTKAFKGFINSKKNSQNAIDFVSVITYNGSPNVDCVRQPIMSMNASMLDNIGAGGGTEFTGAFREAHNIIARDPVSTPVIIFMSDGDANDPSAYITTQLMANFGSKNLKIHSIAFGAGAKIPILRNIAIAGGTKDVKLALNGDELFETFQNIAASENSVLYTMVSKFTEEVGKAIGDKLVLEYL